MGQDDVSSMVDCLVATVDFPSVNVAVEEYVRLRDDLRVLQSDFKEQEMQLKGRLEQISQWVKSKADELGVDSFKTPSGTAYRKKKVHYSVDDWETFTTWVRETNNFQCLEKRVAKIATQEIVDNGDGLPPGLRFFEEEEFLVNRPKGK